MWWQLELEWFYLEYRYMSAGDIIPASPGEHCGDYYGHVRYRRSSHENSESPIDMVIGSCSDHVLVT